MAANKSMLGVFHLALLILSRAGYCRWCVKMQTLFGSWELWDIVKKGISEINDETCQTESKKKYAKALFLIQQAMDEEMFNSIEGTSIAKKAWSILQAEC